MAHPLIFPMTALALAQRLHPGNDKAIRETARRLGKQWPQFRPFTLMIANARMPGRFLDHFLKDKSYEL